MQNRMIPDFGMVWLLELRVFRPVVEGGLWRQVVAFQYLERVYRLEGIGEDGLSAWNDMAEKFQGVLYANRKQPE